MLSAMNDLSSPRRVRVGRAFPSRTGGVPAGVRRRTGGIGRERACPSRTGIVIRDCTKCTDDRRAVAAFVANAEYRIRRLRTSAVCNLTWQKVDEHYHRDKPAALELRSMNDPRNLINKPQSQHESTYALLLLHSEERSRNAFEILIYPVLIIGVIIAICQFVFQAVDVPSRDIKAMRRLTNATDHSIGTGVGQFASGNESTMTSA